MEQAKQLVERLYGDRDALVGFQSFPERGSSRGFPSNRVATLEEAWPWALAQNRLRCAVSLLVNPTDGGGVRSANIAGVNALFVDIDGDVELVPPVALPHAVVQTRNGWHVYWVVHDVIMEEFAALQKRLALYYNGDPGVTNLNRALRLPGLLHQKDPAHPFPIRLVRCRSHPPLSQRDVLAGIPPLPAREVPSGARPGGDFIPHRLTDIVGIFEGAGLYLAPLPAGRHAVKCPWGDDHGSRLRGTHDSSTVIWDTGGFRCLHSACDHRRMGDVLDYFGLTWEEVTWPEKQHRDMRSAMRSRTRAARLGS